MELEWSRVFYSFYYFLGYLYWHLENIRQKIQIYSNALHSCTAIHVMSSKGFMNLAALKPYIPHWTLHNNVGINSTRNNPQGDSQRCRKRGTGKWQDHVLGMLCQFGVSSQHFSPQKIRAHKRFSQFVGCLREGEIWDFCVWAFLLRTSLMLAKLDVHGLLLLKRSSQTSGWSFSPTASIHSSVLNL